MADKKTQALKRLVKKLSALRATLRSDERALLDQLILGSAAEVDAHAMPVGKAAPRVADASVTGKPIGKPIGRAAEVEAHAMPVGKAAPRVADASVTGRPIGKPIGRAAEVAAHAMPVGKAAPKKIEVEARSITKMIEFDAKAKVYRVKNP